MLRYIDSFATYTTITDRLDAGSTGSAGNSGMGRSTGTSGYVGGGSAQIIKVIPAASEVIVGIAFRHDNTTALFAGGGMNNSFRIEFWEGVTNHMKLTSSVAGPAEIKFGAWHGNGTLMARGTTEIALNRWYYVEARVKIHDTTGQAELRLNGGVPMGTVEFNASNIDTRNGGTSGVIDKIIIVTDNNATTRCADFYILDTTGTKNNDFRGDVKVEPRLLTSDVMSDWESLGSSPNRSITPSSGTITVTSNNVTNPGNLRNANDGDYAEFSTSLPSWVRLTFSVPQELSHFMWRTTTDGNAFGTGTLETSNGTSKPIASSAHLTYVEACALDAPETVDWIQINYLSGGGGLHLIYEFQSFGPAATNRANVMASNDDTDYNRSDTPGDIDQYGASALATIEGTVFGVQLVTRMRKDDTGAREARGFIESNAVVGNGATRALSTSYIPYVDIYEVNPDGSVDWTLTTASQFEVGYEVVS